MDGKSKKYIATIGMETHVELRTNSKMFCGCPADHFGKKPNTQTCPVCLGLPGALPVPNKRAIEWTIMIGLSLNCKIKRASKFDRKHYFYPDLPKGYQISQYDEPVAVDGYLETSFGRVGVERVHIEEDTGKLQHKKLNGKNVSLVDFNRSGVPLVEIVTKPDIHSGAQAKEYCQKLQQVVRTLKVTDADMEKGSMRLEANISWGLNWGYKVEVKNLNSFRFVDRAIEYELKRQKVILDEGENPKQETRGWDEVKNVTVSQRYKETASDYRYFPEPDIPPMVFDDKLVIDLKKKVPELPAEKKDKLIKIYKVRETYAEIIVSQEGLTEFAQKVFDLGKKRDIKADVLAGILVNQKIKPNDKPEDVFKLVKIKEERVGDATEVTKWVEEAINGMPNAVADYKKGKSNAVMAIVGRVMHLSRGKADPHVVKKLIEVILKTK